MITFQKRGRFANVAWVVLKDGKETGFSIHPTGSDVITKNYKTTVVFTGFQVLEHKTGSKVVANSLTTLNAAKARTTDLVGATLAA